MKSGWRKYKEEGKEREKQREKWGGGKRDKEIEAVERGGRRERERKRASLQGGFPEVTVLNIIEECGMLNRCQCKHTGRATTASNGCQGLLYIHTNTHKHPVIYVPEHMHSHTEIGYTALIIKWQNQPSAYIICRNIHTVSTCTRCIFFASIADDIELWWSETKFKYLITAVLCGHDFSTGIFLLSNECYSKMFSLVCVCVNVKVHVEGTL